MEILSTGEKIKRARVYQGITLKELCGDKVSISKMSCIENGKIKADKDILEYISKKLGLDYEYLVRDVEEQIIGNLQLINRDLVPDEEMDNVINHNLNYALEYSYNDLAFELIHKLFKHYVKKNKVENIQLIISQYYDLYQKNNTRENTIIYYKDMATFFYSIKDYNEAINYFDRARNLIISEKNFNKADYAYISYRQGKSYEKLGMLEKTYKTMNEALKYINYIEKDLEKGDIYHCFANVCIKLKKDESEKYMELAYKYKKENPIVLAIAKGKSGKSYFYANNRDKAIEEIKEGIELFPTIDEMKYVRFLNSCIRTLYENKEYDIAYEITDKALNSAINSKEIDLIEEAYYLKGMILQKKGLYVQAEMYMNLSLDSLFKFANKEKRHERYLDMAEMYYKLGEVKDSLKYFTLAMKLDKE
ncbi:helix-turn-helix domain-containing protein [Clostridium sp. Sa3CUN1]|uniref:Helix-turn-helix domain-containing protein n=1 Tax=Clostridium gallinarum TaxID=2762246 RepID=A0ABR8Q074_9CLOT|nr:helix-turn-helix transcriptional regulator [Clostridium gallinarum]MBD7913818.1 helix-turn-helix domain-containing protein [Clostridium gallinarum]